MSERDNDIEFDFFDEPETRENAPRQSRIPRRPSGGGGGPRGPIRPPQGFTPLARLVGLIAFAILIVVLLVFWVQSCQGASKRSSYKSYMAKVEPIAHDSEQVGKRLNDTLTTPGIKQADLQTTLDGLAGQETQNLVRAQGLRSPGPLRPENEHVVEALQLRISGLRGLAGAFRSTASLKADASSTAGLLLAAQAQRLTASDVVWDDLFKDPASAELKKQGIGGVAVPDSNFVVNPDLASSRSMVEVFQRIRGASTGGTPGGLHGSSLVSVKALPQGQQLSTSSQNTVRASTALGFAVTVQDTGDSQEVSIPVTLTIQKSPTPIVKKITIDVLNAGESKTVTFTQLDQPPFGIKTTIKVDVQPVPGEKNTGNNSAEYPVIFSLG